MNFLDHPARRRNPTGIAVVVALHVAAAFLAVTGSKVLVRHAPDNVIDVLPLVEPPPQPLPDPVPLPDPPKMQTTIAVPDLPNDITPPPERVIEATRPAGDPVAPPVSPGAGTAARGEPQPHVPVQVAPVVDAKACTRPEYPRGAMRNGDTGTVTLALLIGTDGKVADSKVERSSGSRELDRAAQAGLALCRFQPGTVDGVPYQSWTRMQYVWSLDE